MKTAFLYEHPTWSDQLIGCFRENGIQLKLLNVADLTFDTGQLGVDYDLLINRVNIMPSAQRDSALAFHVLHFLNWLEQTDVQVINGARAHTAGASKAVQNGIFARLGLAFPRAIAIHNPQDALAAAEEIGFPLIVKPNIGGSGSGVVRYDTADALRQGVAGRRFDFGVDRSGLVQEYIHSDGFVYRVEILGDRLFYAIKQKLVADQFNYCAADGCHVAEAQSEPEGGFDFCPMAPVAHIEPFHPSDDIIAQVVSVVQAAGADVGGVEYLIDRKTGCPCFYDFNPYSNFVSNGEDLLGFSPEQRYVDFIASRTKTNGI